MKKIVEIGEDDVLSGILEVTVNTVAVTYKKAVAIISLLYLFLIAGTLVIIADRMHLILANILLLAVYVFSILALKSYMMIQVGMLKKITTLNNTEVDKNGSTKHGKKYEEESSE